MHFIPHWIWSLSAVLKHNLQCAVELTPFPMLHTSKVNLHIGMENNVVEPAETDLA